MQHKERERSFSRNTFPVSSYGKNLFRHMEPSGSSGGIFKDAAYRFQNSVRASWRRFLLLLSTRIIVSSLEPMTDESNRKVLIADDTVFLRDRSKHVELLAKPVLPRRLYFSSNYWKRHCRRLLGFPKSRLNTWYSNSWSNCLRFSEDDCYS